MERSGRMKAIRAARTKQGSSEIPAVKRLPKLQQAAVAQLGSLLETMVRDTDVLSAGNLMADVFESHVVARSKPAPKAGLAVAMLRGRVAREELKQEEGGSISAAEAAERLGLSKTAVLKRYNLGQLVGWREARQGAVRLPVWQFTDDNVLPGFAETLAVLNRASWMDDWARVLFFLNRRDSLQGQRPLDLLRKGKTTPVLSAATAVSE
jgi:hypothetical protein